MKKLKFRGNEENGKKPQNGAKKREFSNTNRLIAGIMTVATAFGIAGCSDKFTVSNNNNHNDGSVDVNEVMDAAIDALLRDSRPDVNNPRDAEVDANHPDSSVDANHPDSSVDANHPDASYDASLPDAGGTVCQPVSETNLVEIQINDIRTVGNIDFRYNELTVILSPTVVKVNIECGTYGNGDPVILREDVELTESQMEIVDATEIGQRISLLNNWAVPNTLSLTVVVQPL